MRSTILIGTLVLLMIVIGCTTTPLGKGSLEGKVTIGPLCPVERIPPAPGCQPTDATYKAFPVAVYSPSQKMIIAEIKPAVNGSYRVELPEGNYVVEMENPHKFGKNLPQAVIIRNNQTTTLDINIDTGIR